MNFFKCIISSGRLKTASLMARVMLLLAVSLVIFAQTGAPMSAQTRSSGGDWIEVCADGGTTYIQLDGTEKQPVECSHCSACVLGGNSLDACCPASTHTFFFEDYAAHAFSLTGEKLPALPAQFWSSNRGPPEEDTETHMNLTYVLQVHLNNPSLKNGGGLWA